MRPTLRSVLLFAGGVPVALLPAIFTARLWTVWLAYTGVALFLIAADAALALGPRRLHVATELPETLFIGEAATLALKLSAPRGVRIEILCDVDETLPPVALVEVFVVAGIETTASLPLLPRRRGQASIGKLWLRWPGPLGLVRRSTVLLLARNIAVIPNIRAV